MSLKANKEEVMGINAAFPEVLGALKVVKSSLKTGSIQLDPLLNALTKKSPKLKKGQKIYAGTSMTLCICKTLCEEDLGKRR